MVPFMIIGIIFMLAPRAVYKIHDCRLSIYSPRLKKKARQDGQTESVLKAIVRWLRSNVAQLGLRGHVLYLEAPVIALCARPSPVELGAVCALDDGLVPDAHNGAASVTPFFAVVFDVRAANGVAASVPLAARQKVDQVEVASLYLLVAREA